MRGDPVESAMSRISLRIDPKQLEEARAALSPSEFKRAAKSAINETIRSGITQISKQVRAELNLSASAVKDRMRPRLAKDTLEGEITVSRKAVPLIEYKPRQVKKGVTVRVRKNGPRELLKSTFIARMKSGHEGVYERRRKAGGKRFRRLPIDQRFGPTVIGVLAGKPGMLDEATDELSRKLSDRFASKVSFILSGGKVGRDPKREET
jgi:hypothetical protein